VVRPGAVLVIGLVLLAIVLSLPVPTVKADTGIDVVNAPGPEVQNVSVGIYLMSINDFDSVKGVYNLEFYLYVFWNSMVVDEPNFQILNAVDMKKELVKVEHLTGGEAAWYLVHAKLFTTPDLKHYPFDTIPLKVILEDASHDITEVNLVWDEAESGVDEMFSTAGWNEQGIRYESSEHAYPWGENYSQISFTFILERNSLSSAVNILLPPMIFCFVSFLAFIITPLKDISLPVRLSLGTGMIISAVLFHVAQSSALPPFGGIRQLDIIMMSAYVAIATSILVTVLCHVYHVRGRPDEQVKKINKFGLILALTTPIVVYVLLYILFV
jgi:hypothetical protein